MLFRVWGDRSLKEGSSCVGISFLVGTKYLIVFVGAWVGTRTYVRVLCGDNLSSEAFISPFRLPGPSLPKTTRRMTLFLVLTTTTTTKNMVSVYMHVDSLYAFA